MNPWLWRLGVAAGAGAAALGARQLVDRRLGAPRPRASDDLFPSRPTIMGHRGAAAVAPENTMAAFAVAARLGLPFELDVRPCRSGELVAMHDATLDRTTDGRGRVIDTPWSVLRTLDAGRHFGPAFAGQAVPQLDTVLATLGGAVPVNIEIKSPAVHERSAGSAPQARHGAPDAVSAVVSAVVDLVKAHELVDRVVISAFDPAVLEAVRYADARIRRGQIVAAPTARPLYERIAIGPRWSAARSHPDLMMVQHHLLTPANVARLKKRGYRVFAWTVNRLDDAKRLVELGVDGLITDDPGHLSSTLPARLHMNM